MDAQDNWLFLDFFYWSLRNNTTSRLFDKEITALLGEVQESREREREWVTECEKNMI